MSDALRTEESVDGRHAWRERNRNAVVDALLDLYQEGIARPSAEEIAARSGVSRRSLFRYFEDMDELCRVAIERQMSRVQHLFGIERFGQGSLDERLDTLVKQRMRLFEAVAPVRRVARSRALIQPILDEQLQKDSEMMRGQLERQLAPELGRMGKGERGRILAAADVLASFEAYDLMVSRQGLSAREAGVAMRSGLEALLAPHA